MRGLARYLFSTDLLAYDFGPRHPFRPERALHTVRALEAEGFFSTASVELVAPGPATREELILFHAADYIDALLAEDEGRLLDYGIGPGDNPFFAGIGRASALIAGAGAAAAGALAAAGGRGLAFSFSGGLHHAHPRFASGFCVVNDVAIAISAYLARTGARRTGAVAYLDIDAHHGDGVLYAFYDDPRVLCVSIHESGRFLFPGTGEASERGSGEGAGYTVNLPLMPGAGDCEFLRALDEGALPAIERADPELLVVQAGTDGYREDPLTHLAYTERAYAGFVERLLAYWRSRPDTRLLVFGGGGYVPWFASAFWATLALSIVNGELTNLSPAGLAAIPGAPPTISFR